jgi:hypothetical protein
MKKKNLNFEQLSRDECIAIFNSKLWKKLSDTNQLKLQLYQTYVLIDLKVFQELLMKLLKVEKVSLTSREIEQYKDSFFELFLKNEEFPYLFDSYMVDLIFKRKKSKISSREESSYKVFIEMYKDKEN